MNHFNFSELIKYVPSSRNNLETLQDLQNRRGDVRIAVFGKYNHGKSTLLNALVGSDIFAAADVRTTVANKEHRHDGVMWIDTPGLDADVHGKDDSEARRGAFKTADCLLLLHNVKAGELDKYEQSLYTELKKQDENHRSKMLLVLTQIDQVEPADLEKVIDEILQQMRKREMPDLNIIPVSAFRYMRGIREGQERFIAMSGMDKLLKQIEVFKDQIESLRKKEMKRLIDKTRIELRDQLNDQKEALVSLKYRKRKQLNQFANDVLKLLAAIPA